MLNCNSWNYIYLTVDKQMNLNDSCKNKVANKLFADKSYDPQGLIRHKTLIKKKHSKMQLILMNKF